MKVNLTTWLRKVRQGMLASVVVGSCLFVSGASASFQLESTGVVLNEQEGRVSFDIRNTSSAPLLLATTLEDLGKDRLSQRLLVSPPITRIDAGQSQQVNFVLRKGEPLTHEVMLKASFEGIMQATDNSAQMPVRQSIGFIVQPASVAVSKTPWDALSFRVEGGELVMHNGGPRVIRMAPTLQLKPSNKIIAQEEYYLMAGGTQRFRIEGVPTSVTFTPLSRYGFKLDEITVPVK